MKNLICLKNVLLSKEAFSRENSQVGLRKILIKLKKKSVEGGHHMHGIVHYVY